MFLSGLKILNPRSESRRSSWLASHGLEASPPTRKAIYTWIVRFAGPKETLNVRTEFMEIMSVKFSRIASTVDRMEGSKNPDTSCLCTNKDVRDDRRGEGQVDYPVSTNFPALIPYWGSLSLREPNLMYWVLLSSENTLFKPSSNLWAKAAMSSGVLNFDRCNFPGRR